MLERAAFGERKFIPLPCISFHVDSAHSCVTIRFKEMVRVMIGYGAMPIS